MRSGLTPTTTSTLVPPLPARRMDRARLAPPEATVARLVVSAMTPPPPLDLNRWAADHVVFGDKTSAFPGRYDPDRFPYFRRILEVLGPDHPAREVVLKKSAQLGGTVIAQIFLGGTMDLDPGPFLYVHPSEGNASRWSKQKWRPFREACKPLKRAFGTSTSRDAANSTLYQERLDGRGWLQVSGANSEASLSMMTVPRQVQDDLAKWEPNSAGDPEVQADSRSKAVPLAKILKISTPLIDPGCRITRAFKASTQEHFHVPCPHCGHEHPLEWENFKAGLVKGEPEKAHFTCPSCGAVIEERHRREMLRRGRWVAHRPGARIVGFHLWAAYSPLERWADIAARWEKAEGDPAAEQTFFNDDLGLAYQAAGESPPWEIIRDRAEASGLKRGVIPAGLPLLCAGIDCQDDRVEIHIRAFGPDRRSATVDYLVIQGHVSEEQTRQRVKDLFKEGTWPNVAGRRIGLDAMAIDGGAWTEDVFGLVKGLPAAKVIMVHGIHGDLAPPLVRVQRQRRRDGSPIKWAKRFFNVGVSPMKTALYKNLKKDDPLERGAVLIPAGMGDDFFQQLTSEKRVPKTNRQGARVYLWVKDKDQRNEVLDTWNYAEAAAIRAGLNDLAEATWDRMIADREAPPEGAQMDLEFHAARPPQPAPARAATPRPAGRKAVARLA